MERTEPHVAMPDAAQRNHLSDHIDYVDSSLDQRG
jgi:hypothetical protein